ncbi:MAG: signal peptide peptidase A [Ponticaulis sp.]|nr:signal peptide peptidase A [Ponticaulis sp.]
MKTFFASVLGGFVALILFLILSFFIIAGVIGSIASSASGDSKAPDAMVLQIDLRDSMSDQPTSAGIGVFFESPAFADALLKLDAAATDPRVKGVFIRSSDFGIGNSRAEELRQALKKLQSSGKFVIAHTQGFLMAGPSAFRSISAADEIWLQPGSDIILPGMSSETLFMKDLFDDLKISAEIEQFYEYKNAPNSYKQSDYTEPHREAMTELLSDIWSASLADIAEDRQFSSESSLRTLLESGPISPETALSSGLVSQLSWPEEAQDAAIERAGEGAEFVKIAAYKPKQSNTSAPIIAIVGGEGGIVTGGASNNPFASDSMFTSDTVSAALLEAGEDENVKAIVFRVDSGGGSAIASDQIWRAVQRVREEHNKPVIVSMGTVAASGGFYVAAGADAILANRTTITGSIGVYGGKWAVADGLREIGINPSILTVGGEFASAFSLDSFTDAQREKLHESLERTYDRFMGIVADGRNMDESRVRELARGRVWSGEDAAELGLIDGVGGLIDAIELAREYAGLDENAAIRAQFYPKPQSVEEAIAELFGASAETAEATARLNALLKNERIQALIAETQTINSKEIQMRSTVSVQP